MNVLGRYLEEVKIFSEQRHKFLPVLTQSYSMTSDVLEYIEWVIDYFNGAFVSFLIFLLCPRRKSYKFIKACG